MKIASFKQERDKRGKILSKLKKAGAEVVFLQETHLNDTEYLKLNKIRFKDVYFSSYKSTQKRDAFIQKK